MIFFSSVSTDRFQNHALQTVLAMGVLMLLSPAVAAQSTIQWIDGSVNSATIESMSKEGVVSGPGVPANTKLDKIVAYETDLPTSVSGVIEVLIAGQGVIRTNQIVIQDATATVSSSSATGLTTTLPLDVIQAVVFARTPRVNKQIAQRSDSEDTVIVNTPEGEKAVAGIFEGLSQGKLGLNFNGKSRKIGIEKVNALSLANLGIKSLTGTEVQLTDGSVLNGKIVRVVNGMLALAITANHTIEIPWSAVVRLERQSDHLVYLSSLEPVAVEQQTIFTPQRPWQRDRSIESNPIRLQDPDKSSPQTYRKGIGTQSYSALQFANTNQFERLQFVAGIDAETNGRGDCQMTVTADGIELWTQRIAADTPPVKVDVDISGMAIVTLIVEPGQQFDLADHADWADAKFVKP